MVESPVAITAASLEAWAQRAFRNRLKLHLQAADPVHDVREQSFTLMSQSLQEAIELVQAAAAALRESNAFNA